MLFTYGSQAHQALNLLNGIEYVPQVLRLIPTFTVQ